jgi:hypothetical protein
MGQSEVHGSLWRCQGMQTPCRNTGSDAIRPPVMSETGQGQ